MKYGDVIPIAHSNVDWQIFIDIYKKEFQTEITKNIDNLKDPTAYIRAISSKKILSNNLRNYLSHSWLSVLTKIPDNKIIQFREEVCLPIATSHGGIIVSGTILQWYDTIVVCCNDDVMQITGLFATNAFNLLQSTQYKTLFSKYKVIQNIDGRVILL